MTFPPTIDGIANYDYPDQPSDFSQIYWTKPSYIQSKDWTTAQCSLDASQVLSCAGTDYYGGEIASWGSNSLYPVLYEPGLESMYGSMTLTAHNFLDVDGDGNVKLPADYPGSG